MRIVVAILFSFALALPSGVVQTAAADILGNPKSTVTKHLRADHVDDFIYDRIAFAALEPKRSFKFTMIDNSRTKINGETTTEQTSNLFEIVSFDDRVIRMKFHWTGQSGNTGTSTIIYALNGMLSYWSRVNEDGEDPSTTSIQSAEGSLWPFVKGARLKTTVENDPDWSTENYLATTEYEVIGKMPASTVHRSMTGDAIKIRLRTETRYKESGEVSSNSVAEYALVENLGFAFLLELDYKSADSSYDSYSKYRIVDFQIAE